MIYEIKTFKELELLKHKDINVCWIPRTKQPTTCFHTKFHIHEINCNWKKWAEAYKYKFPHEDYKLCVVDISSHELIRLLDEISNKIG